MKTFNSWCTKTGHCSGPTFMSPCVRTTSVVANKSSQPPEKKRQAATLSIHNVGRALKHGLRLSAKTRTQRWPARGVAAGAKARAEHAAVPVWRVCVGLCGRLPMVKAYPPSEYHSSPGTNHHSCGNWVRTVQPIYLVPAHLRYSGRGVGIYHGNRETGQKVAFGGLRASMHDLPGPTATLPPPLLTL